MTPDVANKAFLAKSTQTMRLKHHKEPYKYPTLDSQMRYIVASLAKDRHTHRKTTETLRHMHRVLNIASLHNIVANLQAKPATLLLL